MVNGNVRKMLGQLLVIGFNDSEIPDSVRDLIRNHNVGGIILFSRNVSTPEETFDLIMELQNEAKEAGHKYPLLISIDQENGIVSRLNENFPVLPGAMLLGATNSPKNAYTIGYKTGRMLRAMGVNWNLAPSVDINNNPENPVIGVRSYGESPTMVTNFAEQSIQAHKEANVISTIKHFPGHGDTDVDSHLSIPVISHKMERLKEIELKPFKYLIKKGIDVVMSSHVYFPAIEPKKDLPATLSENVINGLLRKELGFDGVVTTDCMEMDAITKSVGTVNASVLALKAGIDLIMISHTSELQYGALDAMEKAVQSGEISLESLEKAYGRVMKLKEKHLSWNAVLSLKQENLLAQINHMNMKKVMDIYKSGVTLVKNQSKILPLTLKDQDRILVVEPINKISSLAEEEVKGKFSFGRYFKHLHSETDLLDWNEISELDLIKETVSSNNYKSIIVVTNSIIQDRTQIELIKSISEFNKNIVVVATRNPYDYNYIKDYIKAYINTYEFSVPVLKTAANAILGKVEITGTSPVELKVI